MQGDGDFDSELHLRKEMVLFIHFGLRPKEIGVSGRVAFPVVVDEADGNQSDVAFRIVIAIDTFRIETAYLLADKIVEVFRHILIQIVILGLLIFMIPVGRLAEHQRLVVDESLAHFCNAEHRAILVHHPGIHRGVDVKPLLQLAGPYRIDDVTLII